MKIKLDENLPRELAGIITGLGHDADTVLDEGLGGLDDGTVWNGSQQAERFFVTQDLDFSDIRKFSPGHHFGILLVRLRDPGRDALIERVRGIFESLQVETWARCFVVATEHKVRVRRGP